MIAGKTISLCCVDTKNHALSAKALSHSARMPGFDKIVFITNSAEHVHPGWEHHRIRGFNNMEEFNTFMLKGLFHHIETDYVLSIHYDGFILNPNAWVDEFFNYDYIGAPWNWWTNPPGYAVGNGGFSLRSKRLLKALQDNRIVLAPAEPEDVCICRTYRSYLETVNDIRVAPVDLAARFSYEYGPLETKEVFGFHFFFQLINLYQGDEGLYFINNLNDYVFLGPLVKMAALEYANRGRHAEAEIAFRRIARLQKLEEVTRQFVTEGKHPTWVRAFEECWMRYVD